MLFVFSPSISFFFFSFFFWKVPFVFSTFAYARLIGLIKVWPLWAMNRPEIEHPNEQNTIIGKDLFT